jgi:hypothetical protein
MVAMPGSGPHNDPHGNAGSEQDLLNSSTDKAGRTGE